MGFFGVFSKIGKGIVTGLNFIKGPAQLFSPMGGTLGKIASYIMAVEVLADKANLATSGGLKKEAVAPLAEQAIKSSEIVSGHEIADEPMFGEGVGLVVEGVLKILKSLK